MQITILIIYLQYYYNLMFVEFLVKYFSIFLETKCKFNECKCK